MCTKKNIIFNQWIDTNENCKYFMSLYQLYHFSFNKLHVYVFNHSNTSYTVLSKIVINSSINYKSLILKQIITSDSIKWI